MNFPNIIPVVFGAILGNSHPGACQHADSLPAAKVVEPETPDAAADSESYLFPYQHGLLSRVQLSGGQLTLPFKIRPKAETSSFRLTTDVTIGAYIGLTKNLSKKKQHRLIIPLAAGLTFINLNSSNTTFDQPLQEAEVVPGLTWSTGLILQLEQYSLGLMFGKDYASEVGDQWNYHGKFWWSFGIGFAFFTN
ncbi:MAG: hypothetical protein JNK89_09500 [Saprospiraceae bacterium]|nr:hypothetical protein [Saprospiraceae bacterium]